MSISSLVQELSKKDNEKKESEIKFSFENFVYEIFYESFLKLKEYGNFNFSIKYYFDRNKNFISHCVFSFNDKLAFVKSQFFQNYFTSFFNTLDFSENHVDEIILSDILEKIEKNEKESKISYINKTCNLVISKKYFENGGPEWFEEIKSEHVRKILNLIS